MNAAASKPAPSERHRLASAARLYAVQGLFQMEAAGQSADRVADEFRSHRIAAPDPDGGADAPEADDRLFARLLEDAVSHQGRIDQATDRALVERWPIDRIDPVLRALFRAAGAELIAGRTPPKVVITEYLRVSEAFFAEGPEGRLVNAILDAMARELRPEAFEAR